MTRWTEIEAAAAETGIAVRGAFHPNTTDGVPAMPDGTPVGTLVLAGFVGHGQWPTFAASREAADGGPDPLDRWSRRVIGELAAELDAVALYPFDGPPFLPFQRWAMKAEPVHPSPLGMLIHPDWGLWHSYRGALAFRERWALPAPDRRTSPCDGCRAKPCLSACPVGAFKPGHYDVESCAAHIASVGGSDCIDFACRARRACPVGTTHRYTRDQASFHMRAFQAARR